MHTPSRPSLFVRLLLLASALVASGVGASILIAPAWFHAANGIDLGVDPSLWSEVRAPGAALLALGALIGCGAFVPTFTVPSAAIAAAVYLSYGLARCVSLVIDGWPAPGLVGAMGIELALGGACLVFLLRRTVGASTAATCEELA